MATTYILPSVGSAGVIKLKEPFSGLCADNTPYKVTAIRTLQDIVADGKDPFELFYKPFDLTQETYVADINSGVCILSLTSGDGDLVYVPNSYLASLPVAMGLPYATMMVAVNLGSLPQDMNLSYFMNQMQELAQDLLGVTNADVRAIRASSLTYLSLEDAQVIEAARQSVMDNVVTERAKRLAAENDLHALQQKYNDLEAFTLANVPPSP